MHDYILRRLAALVPVLFLVSIVTFTVNLLLPGDPASSRPDLFYDITSATLYVSRRF